MFMSYQRAASLSSVTGKIFIMVSAVETLFARHTLTNRLKCVSGHSSEPPWKIGKGAMLTYEAICERLSFRGLHVENEDRIVFVLKFMLFSETDVPGVCEENGLETRAASGSESDAYEE